MKPAAIESRLAATLGGNETAGVLGLADETTHVKWLGGAPAASHLFTQPQVAAQAIRDESRVLRQLNEEVRVFGPGRQAMDRR